MEYLSFVWMAASETSLGRFDVIQRRTAKIIVMAASSLRRNAIQPLAKRRQVGALTLPHLIHYGDAPTLLNSMLPPPHTLLAITILLPTAPIIKNELQEEIFTIRDREYFKKKSTPSLVP